MRFLRPRANRSQAQPTPEPVAFDSIAVLRAHGVTEAWVERSATRVSDRLNRGESIEVRSSPDDAAHPLRTEDVIAVVVQPQPNRSPNRMARRRHVLEMRAPPYQIQGTVHMPPGADPVRYLRAVPHRWVAFTDATIVEEGGGEYSVEVVLVQMDHVSRV